VSQLVWWPAAIRDLRKLDPPVARQVRDAILRYAGSGQGDVKRLRPPDTGLRLRVGDWRVRFHIQPDGGLSIQRVLHRSQAYR
jgi:mRNA-degrading endonuclease RelE of RelBE toxin-antitoxin system